MSDWKQVWRQDSWKQRRLTVVRRRVINMSAVFAATSLAAERQWGVALDTLRRAAPWWRLRPVMPAGSVGRRLVSHPWWSR